MLNVFLTEEQQASLPKSEEGFFLEVCKAHQITCERNQLGDYVLLPPLHGKSFVLYSSNRVDKNEDYALRRLSEVITSQGALVLYSSPGSMRNDIMKILGIQIIISFSPGRKRQDNEKLRFFYSLRKKKESLKVIASIIKQLAQENILHYQIANSFDFLENYKQYKLFFSDIPTVLIQIDDLNSEERRYLEKALVCALLEFYGKRPVAEQLQWAKDLIEDLQNKVLLEEEEKQTEANQLFPELADLQTPEHTSGVEKEDEALKVEEIRPESVNIEPLVIQEPENNPKIDLQPEKKLVEKKGKTPVKSGKKTSKSVKKGTLYPPSNGPVFRFAVPEGNNYALEYPRRNPESSARTAIATLDLDYHKAPPKPWEFPQEQSICRQDPTKHGQCGSASTFNLEAYNALEELKNLAGFMTKDENKCGLE